MALLKMKNAVFQLIFLLLCAVPCFAQNSRYKFTEDILKDLNNDRDFGMAATKFSYIGEYKKDLEYRDLGETRLLYKRTKVDSTEFRKRYKAVSAREYILKAAQNRQIIIFNEAHNQPMHRVFTESLLHDLYKMGFRYFGAETFNHFDTLLNKRKYPHLNSGFYTSEPQFSNMVRTALKEGFTTFAYEQDFKDSTDREIQQAKYIKAILDKDPKARIVIHCGFGHIYEESFGGFTPMATRLKAMTGIDPLTVEQEVMTEHSKPKFEESYYDFGCPDFDAVYVDSANTPFYISGTLDMQVFHKRTKFINGRPDWVFSNGRKPCPIVEKIKTSFPCLVFAYHANEDTALAIPADIIEVRTKVDDKVLALAKGKYIIIVKDMDGEKQVFTTKF